MRKRISICRKWRVWLSRVRSFVRLDLADMNEKHVAPTRKKHCFTAQDPVAVSSDVCKVAFSLTRSTAFERVRTRQ